ncbi:unnamed protein product, partial [Ectocarpus sp. 8 AP-2014]
ISGALKEESGLINEPLVVLLWAYVSLHYPDPGHPPHASGYGELAQFLAKKNNYCAYGEISYMAQSIRIAAMDRLLTEPNERSPYKGGTMYLQIPDGPYLSDLEAVFCREFHKLVPPSVNTRLSEENCPFRGVK